MNKIKVVFLLPNFHGGGAERVAINYIRQLDSERYHVILAVLNAQGDLKALVPSSAQIVNLKSSRALFSFFKVFAFLRRQNPYIVYSTHSRISCLISLCSFICKKFKHIARVPNSPVLERRYQNFGLLSRVLFTFGYRKASVVVAQTTEMKRELVSFYHLDPNSVVVLSNPIDEASIRSSLRSTSTDPFDKGYISAVAAGRINDQKGFDLLVKALPAVLKRFPQFRLYILGQDRGALPQLKQLIADLELKNSVSILGFKKNPYIYYNTCSLFVLSSRWEGFPNSVLENYYLNTPVVATRCVPIVEELIEDGVNGALCEVEDVDSLSNAIIRCISISRNSISNKPYSGSNLEVLLE